MVTDPKGNAVVGAKIWAIRTFSAAAVSAPIVTTADTDAKGAYLVSGLPPASYRICVSAEGAMPMANLRAELQDGLGHPESVQQDKYDRA
jgi:hypothetical protein